MKKEHIEIISQKLDLTKQQIQNTVALLNEGYLKRIGAELHDGPAQDLGLSILKLDSAIEKLEKEIAFLRKQLKK